ncbi:MAG: tRNA (adenine(22)-N(1))-methyltransferase [Betaproteobacteria bacterium]
MRLPRRLEAVLRQVIPGSVVADIGTGHGLLALALVKRGLASRVIATERSPGPLAEAERLLAGVEEGRIALREGWGLAPLSPGEAAVLVLAGMGGDTVCAILDAGLDVARSARQLVLQPQNKPDAVRRWLLTHGFTLAAEDLVAERGHFYPVVGAVPALQAVSPGATLEAQLEAFARRQNLPPVPASRLLEIGPLLLAKRHPVLRMQLRQRIAAARGVAGRLARLGTPRATQRLQAVREELHWLEMMEEWVSRSAPS